ncbi:hypothetical protein CPB83DRAFT_894398 [Crepidotus variabilis]|uniref:Uncharacterized protein n=1 Tax=Crepidotus variabilis TaxID=179855 RepID=A0A9P6EG01_9AGAR|nr:hypothetical protein CPB83DRAFT_894398 [Crepidotus variabilis]
MSQYYPDDYRQLHSRAPPSSTAVGGSVSAQPWDHLYVERTQQQSSHVCSSQGYDGSEVSPPALASASAWQVDAYPGWSRTQLSNMHPNPSENPEHCHLTSQGAYIAYDYGPSTQQPPVLEPPQRHALPEAYIRPPADFQVQPSLLSTTNPTAVTTRSTQEAVWDGGHLVANSSDPDFGNEEYTPYGVAGGEAGPSRQTSSDIQSPSLPATTVGVQTVSFGSSSPVKVEPDDRDGRFIMELTSYSSKRPSSSRSTPSSPGTSALNAASEINSQPPPAEVPLRATQAPKEMRRMMGVFRLNPFAMHSLSVVNDDDPLDGSQETSAASWCGGEARPLEEEPIILEFQLNIAGLSAVGDGAEDLPAGPSNERQTPTPLLNMDEAKLRSFSPSFELHSEDIDVTGYHSEGGYQSRNPGLIEVRRSPQANTKSEDCPRSDNDDTGSTSTSQSVRTPRNDLAVLQSALDHQQMPIIFSQPSHHFCTNASPPLPSPSLWNGLDCVSLTERYPTTTTGTTTVPLIPASTPKSDVTLPETPQRSSRLHTVNSHPYLRKVQQSSPMYNPHAYMPQPQLFRSISPQQSSVLLNTPTHHTQPPSRGTAVHTQQGEEYFSSHRLPSTQPGMRNGGQHGSRLSSPPFIMPSQSVHGRRHGFTQSSTSYMRPSETYRAQSPLGGYPTTQTMQSSRLGEPATSSPTMPLPSTYSAPQQQFMVGGPEPVRRWSLPESGGRFNQVPFVRNP